MRGRDMRHCWRPDELFAQALRSTTMPRPRRRQSDFSRRFLAVSLLLWAGICAPSPTRGDPFPPVLQWKRLVGPSSGAVGALSDSLVFIGRADGTVQAVSRVDGVRRWQRQEDGPLARAMLVSGDSLFYADAWGKVTARRASTGEGIWEAQRLKTGQGAIVVADSVLLVGSADGWLYGLHRGSGRQLWRLRTGSHRAVAPVTARGLLYVGTGDRQIVVARVATGERLLQRRLPARLSQGWTDGERLMAGCDDGFVRVFAAQTLEPLWATRLGALLVGSPLLCGGLLVGVADNGFAYGLRLSDGAVAWKTELGSPPSDGLLRRDDGSLLVATNAGRLISLDPQSGKIGSAQLLIPGKGARLSASGAHVYASVEDGYLYALTTDAGSVVDASGADAGPGGRELLREDWWEVVSFGDKTGYVHRAVWPHGEGFRIREEAVSWRSGFSRTVTDLAVDGAYHPLSMARRRTEESQIQETEAVWRFGHIHIQRRLGDQTLPDQVRPAVEAAVFPEILYLKLAREGRIVAGGRDSLQLVNYGSFQATPATVTYGQWTEGPHGQVVEAILRGVRGPEIRTWVSATGRELRSEVPGLGSTRARVSRSRARAWLPPRLPRSVRLDHAVADPAALTRLVIRLPFEREEAGRLLVEDHRQRIFVDSSGSVFLEVRRPSAIDPAAATILPVREPELLEFLEPSLFIQSNADQIQQLARDLRGSERNALAVARRLHQWVYDHMIPVETNVRFRSTLEVLDDMEGTCSEYTVLYTALCRAAGVPARVSTGFAVSRTGELRLHMWSQVYVGQWLDADPSWDAFPVGAAHIKTGEGVLTAAGMAALNLPLRLFLARADTLELVAYQTESGPPYLGEAERLFADARRADGAFETESAMALFHQLVLLPWNHRSGEAHIEMGRHYLQRKRLDDAEWALRRILHLDPSGSDADAALFYLSRVAEDRGQAEQAAENLEQLMASFPHGDLADAALARLAELRQRESGCAAARPYSLRLIEEYGRSGWAAVARSSLERCGAERELAEDDGEMDGNR